MFKLIKYEFRKALNTFLILCGITAVLQCLFQYGLASRDDQMLIITMILLVLCAFGVAVFVLVRGITTYTGELKNRSGYLTFLTPNSTIKIVASKFLYTFLNALLAFAIFCVILFADVSQLLVYLDGYKSMIEFFSEMIDNFGIHLNEILLYIGFDLLFAFTSLLAFVAVAYFATTLSATFFRDKRWSWLVSLGLFLLINYGITRIDRLFLTNLDSVQLIDLNLQGKAAAITVDVWNTVLLPAFGATTLVSVAVILISLFSCAYMLDKKVSL